MIQVGFIALKLVILRLAAVQILRLLVIARFHTRITIANIHPERAVIAQYPLALTEHLNEVCDVLVRRNFQSNLLVNADCATFTANILIRCPA